MEIPCYCLCVCVSNNVPVNIKCRRKILSGFLYKLIKIFFYVPTLTLFEINPFGLQECTDFITPRTSGFSIEYDMHIENDSRVIVSKQGIYADVAQLVEQCFRKAEVVGSTPTIGYLKTVNSSTPLT